MTTRTTLLQQATALTLVASAAAYAAPARAGDVGNVTFVTSCDAKVREQFNRAVALLHSFEYDEARAEFAEVQKRDPSCAMTCWGLAMTDFHPLWAAPTAAELERGRAAAFAAPASSAPTAREHAYVDAIRSFYDGPANRAHRERLVAYEASMAKLYAKFPEDPETGIFYALALNAAADPTDKSFSRQRKGFEILAKLAVKTPKHPGIAHYMIHNFDAPELADAALPAARAYAKIAPASAHAQHMPSHIFTRLGLWQESIASNLDSTAAARAYAAKHNLAPAAWDEELHGMDYLAFAYLQVGMDDSAHQVLDHLNQIDKVSPINLKSAYAFAAIPARYALERHKWTDAAALSLRPKDFPWPKFPQFEAISIFARAYGSARAGDAATAQVHIAKLRETEARLRKAGDAYWANSVLVQALLASAWVEQSKPERAREALQLARQAADLEDSAEKHPVTPGPVIPARESLAELLLLQGQPEEALREYERSLLSSPNRLNGLYGAARAAEAVKDLKKARKYYAAVLENCSKADPQHPTVRAARAFMAQLKTAAPTGARTPRADASPIVSSQAK